MARVRLAAPLITIAAAQTFMQRREIPVLKAPQDSWVLLEGIVNICEQWGFM